MIYYNKALLLKKILLLLIFCLITLLNVFKQVSPQSTHFKNLLILENAAKGWILYQSLFLSSKQQFQRIAWMIGWCQCTFVSGLNVGWIQSTCLKHFLSWQSLSVMMNSHAFCNSFLKIIMIRFELISPLRMIVPGGFMFYRRCFIYFFWHYISKVHRLIAVKFCTIIGSTPCLRKKTVKIVFVITLSNFY